MEQGQLFGGGSAQGDSAEGRRFEFEVSARREQREARWREALRGVVETEILPRLRKAHPPEDVSPIVATAEDAEIFVRVLLAEDGSEAAAHVASLRERTAAADRALLSLLARTARHFGDLWAADLCDFIDVTIGLGRLHLILRAMSVAVESTVAVATNARRALLLPAPGETHGFGIAMVQYAFRSAGWRADYGLPSEYAGRLHAEWFDLVGFSVSCDNRLESLRSAIEAARRVSRNPALLVMAGGPALVGRPDLALAAGADGSADDAVGAVDMAESLLDRRSPV